VTVPAGLRYQEDDVDLCIACTPIKYHREGLSAMKCKILCLIILLTATSAFPQADQRVASVSVDDFSQYGVTGADALIVG